MGYRQALLPTKGRLEIDREPYVIDLFGMDDGLDRRPDATFRFLFQLGSGYMIYRYVVGAMQPGDDRFLHSFWTKDCVVAWIDEEEHGPPATVRAEPVALPVLYEHLWIERFDHVEGHLRFEVISTQFTAALRDLEGTLVVDFQLLDASGRVASLTWSLADRWVLSVGGLRRTLAAPERVTFL